jgi:hypothetical protein
MPDDIHISSKLDIEQLMSDDPAKRVAAFKKIGDSVQEKLLSQALPQEADETILEVAGQMITMHAAVSRMDAERGRRTDELLAAQQYVAVSYMEVAHRIFEARAYLIWESENDVETADPDAAGEEMEKMTNELFQAWIKEYKLDHPAIYDFMYAEHDAPILNDFLVGRDVEQAEARHEQQH